MNQRGFLAFLLGNPLLLLSAGLGIALVVCGITGKVYKTQRDHARQEAEQVRNQFAGFRAEVERLGKEAAEKAKAQEDKQRKVSDDLRKKLHVADARLADANRRLRERPPVDPSGRELSTTACSAPGVDGKGQEPGQWVSLADYRALEERSLKDVQTLKLLDEWLTAQGLAR